MPLEDDQLRLANGDDKSFIDPKTTNRLLSASPGIVYAAPLQTWPGAVPPPKHWLRTDVLPRANGKWSAGPERFEEMIRLRELGADGDEILAVGEELLVSEKAARDAVCAEIDPTLSPDEVADLVKDDHAPTFAESLQEYRAAMDAARGFVVEHRIATPPPEGPSSPPTSTARSSTGSPGSASATSPWRPTCATRSPPPGSGCWCSASGFRRCSSSAQRWCSHPSSA